MRYLIGEVRPPRLSRCASGNPHVTGGTRSIARARPEATPGFNPQLNAICVFPPRGIPRAIEWHPQKGPRPQRAREEFMKRLAGLFVAAAVLMFFTPVV